MSPVGFAYHNRYHSSIDICYVEGSVITLFVRLKLVKAKFWMESMEQTTDKIKVTR